MDGSHSALTLVLALGAGVIAQSLARHVRVPGIVLLLLFGSLLGPDFLGWVRPRELGSGLFNLVELSVAVILFEGGLNLEISRLRREQAAIRRLVTVGALTTLGGAAACVHGFLGWPWHLSILFGSLVVVTGPTVIGPLVSELRLRSRVSTVLSAEGVLIDPVGAILAVLVLGVVLAPNALADGALDLFLRVSFGAGAGAAMGLMLAGLLRVRRLIPEGHENIFVLAAVLVLAEGCNAVVSQSGILAVTIAGVVVGNLRTPVDRDLREFKDQLTILLVGLLFITLSADVRIDQVRSLGGGALAVLAGLILVVRPLTVWVATIGSDLSWRERLFVAWVAPRGIVAAAVASLVATTLEANGIPGGAELRALVFLTIVGTVVQAGLTAGPVARWLGVRLPERDTLAVLGAQGLGLALAEELRDSYARIVFLDSNPQSCRRAEEAGYSVIFGNGVEERSMQRARFLEVRSAVAITSNQTVNSVFVSHARDRFGVPDGYLSADQPDSGLVGELLARDDAALLFEASHDVERWDVRARHGDLELLQLQFDQPEQTEAESQTAALSGTDERYVFLSLRRDERVEPFRHSGNGLAEGAKAGDVAGVALYSPEREQALEALAEVGWRVREEAGETSA